MDWHAAVDAKKRVALGADPELVGEPPLPPPAAVVEVGDGTVLRAVVVVIEPPAPPRSKD